MTEQLMYREQIKRLYKLKLVIQELEEDAQRSRTTLSEGGKKVKEGIKKLKEKYRIKELQKEVTAKELLITQKEKELRQNITL